MSKTFDSFQKSTIKNAAKAVAHFQARKDKLDEQIAGLQAQSAELNEQIETYNKAVTDLTGGYTPLELCEKVARNGGSNEWVFKYPETIIPIAEKKTSVQEETPQEETTEFPTDMEPDVESVAESSEVDTQLNENQEENNNPNFETESVKSAVETEIEVNDPMNDIFA